MNTIVFVEDDPEVGSLIVAYLTRYSIEVILEPRDDLAEEKILHVQPDLVLLGIMLPGKDGVTIYRDLRGRWQSSTILLTSLDSNMNHILALEVGAYDYVLRTTPPAVLLARLHLYLRQNEHSAQSKGIQAATITPHTTLRFGTLTADPTNRSVLLGGEQVSLSTTDFELLWELAAHTGQIMDRDALLENLRGVSYNGVNRGVDVAISRLRKKLLDNATEPHRTKTIRDKGYLFAPHAWGDEPQKQSNRAGRFDRPSQLPGVTLSR